MALTETRPETETEGPTASPRPTPTALERLVGTGSYASIGRLYIGFSLVFAVAAGVVRLLVGLDIATDNGFLGSRVPMLNASSLLALILLGAVPFLLGLAISVVPRQVGSPSIAFPRAAALSFWAWLITSGIFITSVAINGGVLGGDRAAARLGNVAIGGVMASLVLGAVLVATTVVVHRPMGMRLANVPLFSWSMLVGSTIWIATFGSVMAHVLLGQVSHLSAEGLVENFGSGIYWLLRGPAIYMVAIPVLGIAGDVLPAMTGRRLKHYGVFQGLIGAFAVLSFGAWAQLPSSVNTVVWAGFALAVALPILGLLGGLAESLRYGKAKINGALVCSLTSLLLLLGGAIGGVLQAFDTLGTGYLFEFGTAALVTGQAYFVVAGALVGGIGGLFYWSTKLWGGPAKEPIASGLGVLVFLGGGLIGTVLIVQAIVQRNQETTANQFFGALSSVGILLVVVGLLGVLAQIAGIARHAHDGDDDGADDQVERDPWNGLTLEWADPADELVTVTSPYPLLDAREGDEEGSK